MIWQALPYVIGVLVLLNLLLILVLLGVSAWECYRDDRVEEELQTAWSEVCEELAQTRAMTPLEEHMGTLQDPASICNQQPGVFQFGQPYRTNFGQEMSIEEINRKCRPAPTMSIYDDKTAIHHIDGNPLNNQPDNLELVPIRDYRTNYGRRMRGDR